MIVKITKGRDPRGLVRYLFREGRAEEHVDPRLIASSALQPERGEPALAGCIAVLDDACRRRPDVRRPVWHASLRTAPEDPNLEDATWALIAEDFVSAMGMAEAEWVAVRHGADHIHVALVRVTADGVVLRDSHDFRRGMRVAREIERSHGLADASDPRRRVGPRARVTKGERQRAERLGLPASERERLATSVRDAAAIADSADDLARLLAEQGVEASLSVATTGRVAGAKFRFAAAADRDPGRDGSDGWWRGSSLHRDLGWKRLQGCLYANANRGPERERDEDRGRRACRDRGRVDGGNRTFSASRREGQDR